MLKACFHALYREVAGIDPLTCDVAQLIPLSYLYHDLYGSVLITQDETEYGSCKQIYERSQEAVRRIKSCLKSDLPLTERAEAILALQNAYYTILDVQWLNEALSLTEELAQIPHESCGVLEKAALSRLYSMYAHYIPGSTVHKKASDQVRLWSEAQDSSGSWGGEFSDQQALAVLHALNEYGYLTLEDRYEDTVARGISWYSRRIEANAPDYRREEKMYSLGLLYRLRLMDAPGSHTTLPSCREIASEIVDIIGKEKIASACWLQGVTLLGNYVTEETLDELSENLFPLQSEASGK